MKKTNIFVSSTCYDLSQIRTDIHDFIEDNGHTPILSELKNFPFNPFKKAVDSCIEVVKNDADIFVLIIGNRYGAQIESGISITNTEFLTAKQKGIPIYIFIDKKIINILPVWSKNKGGDYSDIVDSIKIFEFVTEIRNDLNMWSFEFERAQDIISTLKNQLSFLFKESLALSTKYKSKNDDLFIANLSNEALRIFLEKQEHYELEFFIQTLLDEMKKKEALKNDYTYKIILESKYIITDNESLLSWIDQRCKILLNLLDSLGKIMHKAYPDFYAESGIPSDMKGLYYVSTSYARIFESVINWTVETESACVSEECHSLIEKLSKLSHNMINNMWEFPFTQKAVFDEIKIRLLNGEKGITHNSTLTIDIDPIAMDEYNIEFEKFSNLIKSK